MDDAQADRAAFDTAERLLGAPLVLPLGPSEPPSGDDFRRLATRHTFGDSWTRTGLDVRSRALVSVTIAATLGAREPLRATKPDFTGMGRRYISADVAPCCGMHAVNTSNDARNDVIPVLEVQAHASGLVG